MAYNNFYNSIFPGAIQPLITGGHFTVNSTQIQRTPKGGYERLLEAVAPNALHNSGHVFDPPRCHPGTRIAVIQTIFAWISRPSDDVKDKHIVWLTGAAGAGKSAIGRCVCERCATEGILLASFFFGSNDATRNHTRSLVGTIVYQICCLNSTVRQTVTMIIDNDPLIFNRSLREQFSALVLNPLSFAFADETSQAQLLIVIDGLDECRSYESQLDVLQTLIEASHSSYIPIRFLLCSRSENQIINFFSSPRAQKAAFKIFLGDEYFPYRDIELYLQDSFQRIKEGHIFKHLIPDTWPDKEHVHGIAQASSGQFIYATTVVRYVESSHHRPHQRLEAILGLRPPFKDLPFAQLDALYIHILERADEPTLILDILAFLALYGSRARSNMIEAILGLEPGDVEMLLSDFGSIIDVRNNCPSLLHKSFSDFMFDPHRSKKLFKDRAELSARHTHRIIQVYSEDYVGCRLMSLRHPLYSLLRYVHISSEDWSSTAFSGALDAIIHFPMELFCKILFAHNRSCVEAGFIFSFLTFIQKFKTVPSLVEAFHFHVESFCNAVLAEIHRQYDNDWVSNYTIASHYLLPGSRKPILPDKDNLFNALNEFSKAVSSLCTINSDIIGDVLRRLATDVQKSEIFSRASASCLQIICDSSYLLRKTSQGYLQIGRINRRNRKLYPWKWHRRSWSRLQADQPIFMVFDLHSNGYILTTFRKLFNHSTGSASTHLGFSSVYQSHHENVVAFRSLMVTRYLNHLSYFIRILPYAGRYTELIDLCKKKSLSAMSMVFPELSRKARRVISEYLERMETASDTDE